MIEAHLNYKDGIRPEYLEHVIVVALKELQSDTKALVKATLDKEKSEEHVSFAEATKILGKTFDLTEARDNAMKAHKRWGYIDKLISMRKIKSHEEYMKLFDQVSINKKDLMQVKELIKDGIEIIPIFDAELLLPHELVDALNIDVISYTCDDLDEIKQINPDHVPELYSFTYEFDGTENNWPDVGFGDVCGEQKFALIKAYHRTNPLQPTGSRILFTSNVKFGNSYMSPIKVLQEISKNDEKRLDLCGNILRMKSLHDSMLKEKHKDVDLEMMDLETIYEYDFALNESDIDEAIVHVSKDGSIFLNKRSSSCRASDTQIFISPDYILPDGKVVYIRFCTEYSNRGTRIDGILQIGLFAYDPFEKRQYMHHPITLG
ncbi:hypothetical protein ACFLZH_02460 [Patescibacteria group bacterium]